MPGRQNSKRIKREIKLEKFPKNQNQPTITKLKMEIEQKNTRKLQGIGIGISLEKRDEKNGETKGCTRSVWDLVLAMRWVKG